MTMTGRNILSHLMILLVVTSWGHGRPQDGPREGRQAGAKTPGQERSTFFDVELLEVLMRQQQDRNVVLSPISVKLLLGMLMEGAEGTSRDEILHALRFTDPETARITTQSWVAPFQNTKSAVLMKLATHMFVANDYKINATFAKTLRAHYGGDVTNLDVTSSQYAADTINGWASDVTNGVIPSLVGPEQIGPDTYGLLASAVYFKGSWRKAFESTLSRCFYRDDQCTKSVFMQKTEILPYAYVSSLDADVVEIPYKEEGVSMLVLRPRGRVKVLSRDLVHEHLDRVLAVLEPTELHLQLPRFTANFQQDIVPALRHLQIAEVFGRNAQLGAILETGNYSLTISAVLHSAKLVVDEEGSEGAAATAAQFVPLIGKRSLSFVADKPFLFLIRDSLSKVVLFAGRVSSPEVAPPPPPQAAPSHTDLEAHIGTDSSNLLETGDLNDNHDNVNKNFVSVTKRPGRPEALPVTEGRPNGFLNKAQPSAMINFQDKPEEPKPNPEKRKGATLRPTAPPPLYRQPPTKGPVPVSTRVGPISTQPTLPPQVLPTGPTYETPVVRRFMPDYIQDYFYGPWVRKEFSVHEYKYYEPSKVRRSPDNEKITFV